MTSVSGKSAVNSGLNSYALDIISTWLLLMLDLNFLIIFQRLIKLMKTQILFRTLARVFICLTVVKVTARFQFYSLYSNTNRSADAWSSREETDIDILTGHGRKKSLTNLQGFTYRPTYMTRLTCTIVHCGVCNIVSQHSSSL